jgi:FkbM family methyltransferase
MKQSEIDKLDVVEMEGFEIFYRKDTTDLNCLKEVLIQKCYKHTKHNIFVNEGETWLDLGGNMGAFGLYCELRKASNVISFEPDSDNYDLMKLNYENNLKNTKFDIFQAAVTVKKESEIQFFKAYKETDRYRFSTIKNNRPTIKMPNVCVEELMDMQFDGIKMDIEGSEFDILDQRKLPNCKKLIMEYHITKDKSMRNFHSRMDYLRQIFKRVHYFESLDKFDRNGNYPGFFDRVIFCTNER